MRLMLLVLSSEEMLSVQSQWYYLQFLSSVSGTFGFIFVVFGSLDNVYRPIGICSG